MEAISKRAYIFDLDGTLLDSTWLWDETDKEMLAHFGITPPPDFRETVNPMGIARACAYTVERFSLPVTPEELMRGWAKTVYNAYANRITLKPGVSEYLLKLHRAGCPLAIATALDAQFFMPCLERNGVAGLFSAIATVSEAGVGKSDPAVYLLAADRLGVTAEDATVFEDDLLGATTAHHAGFRVVGVADPVAADRADLMRATCDRYIQSFEELL